MRWKVWADSLYRFGAYLRYRPVTTSVIKNILATRLVDTEPSTVQDDVILDLADEILHPFFFVHFAHAEVFVNPQYQRLSAVVLLELFMMGSMPGGAHYRCQRLSDISDQKDDNNKHRRYMACRALWHVRSLPIHEATRHGGKYVTDERFSRKLLIQPHSKVSEVTCNSFSNSTMIVVNAG